MTSHRRARRNKPGRPGVGLFGLLGQGNLGNDGSMAAVLAYLRRTHPDVAVDSLCTHPEVITEQYGIPASQLRWYRADSQRGSGISSIAARSVALALGVGIDARRIASWVARHDAVIVPGMGVLETTVPMRPWKTPYWIFLLCAAGRLFHTKVALVSVGANVTEHRLTRLLITSGARLAHYRSYRDALSRDAMAAMGVDTSSDPVYPDVAFALPVPQNIGGRAGNVGIGIMDYSGGNDDLNKAAQLRANYIEQIKRFVRWLADNGRPVRLFTSDSADEPVLQDIADDLRAHRPDLSPSSVIAEPAASPAELMQQIAAADTVVATRYHNVLFALLLGKPTLALAYAGKHERLMADAGLLPFCLPCRDLDAAQMIDLFNELERQAPTLRQAIGESCASKVHLIDNQLAEMSAVLFPQVPSAGTSLPDRGLADRSA